MRVITIAASIACGLTILLSTLNFTIESTAQERYEKVVKSLMLHEGLSSFQEVLDAFPELKDIKSKMSRISYLSNSIHRITEGPAPNVSKTASLQVQTYSHEIRQLRESTQADLSQLAAIYQEDQP